MITIVFSEKGGVGKSRCAENYSVELAHRGHSVCLVDADPQGNAADFIGYREEAEIEPYVTCVQKRGRLTQVLRELDTKFDHVVVDVAGRADEHTPEMRTGLLVAHVAITPLKPCQDNINTLPKVAQIVDDALDLNENLQVFSLISIAPTHHAGKEIKEAREIVSTFESIPLLDTVIHDRKVFRDAYAEGKGVVEMQNKSAADDIRQLVTEILEKVSEKARA